MAENKQLAKKPEKQIANFLQMSSKSLFSYASRKYNRDAFIKSAMLAIIENDDLKNCINSNPGQLSLFGALRYAATNGLSLNPQEGKAALIPYKGKVSYQIMKNGLIDLAMDSGAVESIISYVVRENDVFSFTKTSDGDKYEYTPARSERGEIEGFFAAVKFKDSVSIGQYMTLEQVEDHRDKYSKGLKDGNGKPRQNHAWVKSFEGMGLKTVIKRLFRNVSISPVMDEAVGIDDGFECDTIEIKKNGFTAEGVTEEIKKNEKREKVDPPIEVEAESEEDKPLF